MILLRGLLSFTVLAVLTLLFSIPAYAQYGYGYGGVPGQPLLLVEKMVGRPSQTKGGLTEFDYVDNLSSADTRFRPGQQVTFRVKIKNPSNVKVVDVTAKDIVPSSVEPVEGPGSYDSATRTITWNVGDLNAGEERIIYIRVQIVSQNQLPADKGVFCLINRAQAQAERAFAEDIAQFCIEKEVIGAPQVPAAGPAFAPLLLSGQIALLGFGFLLRRKFSS